MKKERVLITGAGGFIGSHLCQACLDAGYDVRAFVHYNSRGSAGWLDELPDPEGLETVAGDIRDPDVIRAAARGCPTVFHLAALIGIPYSYLSPAAYLATNATGTLNVLEACRESGAENILVVSTSEVYGTARYVPMDEQHPLSAQSPYAASKIAAEQVALSYHRSFGLPVKVVRPFNVYGPRQSLRAVIPSILVQLLRGAPEVEVGATHPRRDLTYVGDMVRALLAVAAADGLGGEVVNIGMNTEHSVEEILRAAAGLAGREARPVFDPRRARPAGSEVDRLRCDNTKLVSRTGWSPAYDLGRGLADTLAWWKDRLPGPGRGSYAL
jgi:NAD dependent epimerase/dehydratase